MNFSCTVKLSAKIFDRRSVRQSAVISPVKAALDQFEQLLLCYARLTATGAGLCADSVHRSCILYCARLALACNAIKDGARPPSADASGSDGFFNN